MAISRLFRGRINRVDFFLAIMLHGIVTVLIGWLIIDAYVMHDAWYLVPLLLLSLAGLVVEVSFASVFVRRLHDLNLNGWYAAALLVPIMNLLFGLYLFFSAGVQNGNVYGEDQSDRSFWHVLLNTNEEVIKKGNGRSRSIVALIIVVAYLLCLYFALR